MGHIVLNIPVFLIAYGPAHIKPFIHSSAKHECIFGIFRFLCTKKCISLHIFWDMNSGNAQQSGGQVNKTDQAVDPGSWLSGRKEIFIIFRDTNNERYMGPGFINKPFAASQDTTMV